jgi:hypothetical protein
LPNVDTKNGIPLGRVSIEVQVSLVLDETHLDPEERRQPLLGQDLTLRP